MDIEDDLQIDEEELEGLDIEDLDELENVDDLEQLEGDDK